MKRWKLGVLACLVAVSLSALLVGCQSQSYTPAGKDPAVADSSLVKGGVLRVGVNAASAPLAGQTSSSSRIVGIDVDVAAYLADELGLKVEIVDVGTDPASALEEGTVDVALGVDASTDNDMDCWRSSAYLKTGVALFGAKDESSVPTVDSKPKVGAQASSKSSWRVTNLFGDESLVTENDLKSAFESLGKGSVDYVAADAVIGTYVSTTNDYADKIVALLQEPSGYCAAVASKNAELQKAVDNAVKTLVNGGAMQVIEGKWLGGPLDMDNMTIVKGAGSDSGESSTEGESAAPAEGEAAAEAPAEGEAAAEAPAEGVIEGGEAAGA